MPHSGDIVEKLATGRQGKYAERGQISSSDGLERPQSGIVIFSDGKLPKIEPFGDGSEWRVIKCPQESAQPCAVPSQWITE